MNQKGHEEELSQQCFDFASAGIKVIKDYSEKNDNVSSYNKETFLEYKEKFFTAWDTFMRYGSLHEMEFLMNDIMSAFDFYSSYYPEEFNNNPGLRKDVRRLNKLSSTLLKKL